MTIDDVVTLSGFPRERTTRHVQTTLLFYYKRDCQLCRAVRLFSRRGRRRRRQTVTDETHEIIPNDVVHEILDLQASVHLFFFRYSRLSFKFDTILF